MSKATLLSVLIALLVLGLFMPIAMMLLSYSGYTRLETDTYRQVTSENFNVLTLQGIGTGFKLVLELGKFSMMNMPPVITILFVFISILSLIIALMLLRGIGN